MTCVVVIPARWASSRFPGKPLAMIAGVPMIERVWRRARAARAVDGVIIATDHNRVRDCAAGFGADVMMTRADHRSGTDRLIEVATARPADCYINLQGDEPLVDPASIDLLATAMRDDPELQVTSLCHPIAIADAQSPDRVKVVRDHAGKALYFSRSPIPYAREPAHARYWQHVGIYGYRRDVLMGFAGLPPSGLEDAEALEQLRLLSAGIPIRLFEVASTGPGVDRPEDVGTIEQLLAAGDGKTL